MALASHSLLGRVAVALLAAGVLLRKVGFSTGVPADCFLFVMLHYEYND